MTLASAAALLSALLVVAALVLLGVAYIDDIHNAAAGRIGWLTLVASILAGSIAVARGFMLPLRRLEMRARQLASGDQAGPRPMGGEDEMGPLVEAFNSVERRLNLLTDIAELLASAADRTSVLSGITAAMAHMPDASDTGVLLLKDQDSLELVAAEGSLAACTGFTYRLSDLPWVSRALSIGAPVTAVQEHDDPLLGQRSGAPVAVLAAPLRVEESPLGVAIVVRHGGDAFSEPEFETLRSFAAQASVALRNSQLFEEERRSRQEAEWLRAVAERAAGPGSPEETLQEIARMECEFLGFNASDVVLYESAQFGIPSRGESLLGRGWRGAWETAGASPPDATVVFVDMGTALPTAAAILSAHEASGALLTPLYRGGSLEGFLVLLANDSTPPPEPPALALAATVGRQASLVLENAYLYQQARNRADNLETIFRISHAVGSSLQSRIVLNRVLDVVQKILSADAVLLMQYDAQRKHLFSPMARGVVSTEMLQATFRPGEDVPGRIFETHEPERYDHVSATDTMLLNEAAKHGLESLLAVPLLARGRSTGVLVVLARGAGAFTSEDLDLLRTFASQAALAIDNADLFSREHETVRILQESILPVRLPEIPGIETASIYMPGGAEAEIGGDYYDLFATSDGSVVIAIGDVCGKGVHAATKTSMIRHAMRGMIVAGLEPDRVLAELNAMLLEQNDPASSIVTLWLGRLDSSTGSLVYANGGHPAGLLLQADRSIERLSTTGAVLGAVAGAEWTQRSAVLDSGSLLLLYTDGVTEARRGTKFFGEGRVRRALRGGGDAAAVAQRLVAHVQNHAGGEIRDDVAILVLRNLQTTVGCQDVTHTPNGGK